METRDYLFFIREKTRSLDVPLFFLSAICMTFLLTMNYSVLIEYDGFTAVDYQVKIIYAIVAVLIMIPVYLYLSIKKEFVDHCMNHATIASGACALIFTISIIYQLFIDTKDNSSHISQSLIKVFGKDSKFIYLFENNFFVIGLCALTGFAFYVFILYTEQILMDFRKEVVGKLSKTEINYFIIASIAAVSLICFFITRTYGTWNSLDLVYQTDTTFVYNHYYPVFSSGFNFDWDIGNGGIRHPLTTLFTFPINIIVSFLSNLLYFVDDIRPLLFIVIQSFMIIYIGILLARMTGSKWMYFVYTVSFPAIFFSLFLEKYPLCTLFPVLFAYAYFKNADEKYQKHLIVSSAGMMITSAWLGLFYGDGRKFGKRLKGYFYLICLFLLVLVGTGRINYIVNAPYLINHNYVMFNGVDLLAGEDADESNENSEQYTVEDAGNDNAVNQKISNSSDANGFSLSNIKLTRKGGVLYLYLMPESDNTPTWLTSMCHFFDTVACCFVPTCYGVNEANQFYWRYEESELNIIGLIVFVFCVYVSIRFRKGRQVQIFSGWMLLAIVQFMVMHFGIPLFCFYYSWAFVGLVVYGVKNSIKGTMRQFVIFSSMISIMVFYNFWHLSKLLSFLLEYAPK